MEMGPGPFRSRARCQESVPSSEEGNSRLLPATPTHKPVLLLLLLGALPLLEGRGSPGWRPRPGSWEPSTVLVGVPAWRTVGAFCMDIAADGGAEGEGKAQGTGHHGPDPVRQAGLDFLHLPNLLPLLRVRGKGQNR